MSLVRNVLQKKGSTVVSVEPEASALDAAKKMHQHHIGSVLVIAKGEIVGIFTERDLMNRIVAVGKDAAKTPVRDVMTAKVAICEPDTTLETCRAAMAKNKMRHLPVMQDGKLVGIISSGDIFSRELEDQEETIRYLHEYMLGPA